MVVCRRTAELVFVTALAGSLFGCGGGGSLTGVPGDGAPGHSAPTLSPLGDRQDDFGSDIRDALLRAAVAAPRGTTQSSAVENGRTVDEMTVRVVRDDEGAQVYELTDSARVVVRIPGLPRGAGLKLSVFTTLLPGIEPDISSYPHEVLGMWAFDGDAGVFWSQLPSLPAVEFGPRSPSGTATYEGDAVGLYAAAGTPTRFQADVELVADFDAHAVRGTVDGFRSLAGASLGESVVELQTTSFSADGSAFGGETTIRGVAASGKWGAKWSDGEGWTMGGTFGAATDDGSIGILGAFTAGAVPRQ